MIGQIILGLLAVYCLSLLSQFLRNLRLAKRTGLPYVCLPISEFSIPVITLFGIDSVPNFVQNWLPGWLADIIFDHVVSYRWTVRDRRAKALGPLSLAVTPTTVSCNVADAGVVSKICSERRNFPKPIWQYGE